MTVPRAFARALPAMLLLTGLPSAQITPDAGPAPKPSPPSAVAAPASPQSARPIIMLAGYWPPTNEMLRRWSTNKTQNPGGWIGSDWEKRGYDVHSFFPEFPANSWPRGRGDFEVDYQDTSSDFWRITKALRPRAIVTFSRGFFDTSWEIELNAINHSRWSNDSLDPRQPTPSPPDSSVPPQTFRRSTQPFNAIVANVRALNIAVQPRLDAYGSGGSYLSEYLSFHGMWYQAIHSSPTDPDWCITGGHVHVGANVSNQNGEKAVGATLRAVIEQVDRIVAGTCQPNHGLGGIGTGYLSVCGMPLKAGATANLLLEGAPASVPAILMIGVKASPWPALRRMVVPGGGLSLLGFTTDGSGKIAINGIPGGGGPFSLFAQFVYPDSRVISSMGRLSLSNAVELRFLR